MTIQRLIAAAILVVVAAPALAETDKRAEALTMAQGLVEEAPGGRPRTTADTLKQRMSAIADEMSTPGLDPHARERLRIQYQHAVRDYRTALSNKN